MTPAEAERIGLAWIAIVNGEVPCGSVMRCGDGSGRAWIVTAIEGSRAALIEADSWWPKRWGYDGCDAADLSDGDWWIDLRDAATRGAALEVVRERWGAPEGHLYPFERKAGVLSWVFRRFYGADFTSEGDSEAAALLAALEAAPKVSP